MAGLRDYRGNKVDRNSETEKTNDDVGDTTKTDEDEKKNNNDDKKGGERGKQKKKKKTIWGGEISNGQLVKKDKDGNVLVHAITSDKDLVNLGDDDIVLNDSSSITMEEARKGREELIDILADAGVVDLDISTILKLPTWEQVKKLYGDGPMVYGLETCEKFRAVTPIDDASIGVAGMFNTGTNPLFDYLNANCIMPHNVKHRYGGMRWQVPWGKHMIASRKWTNTVKNDKRVNKTNVLPVAIVRDPYTWMQSICRQPYGAKFPHTKRHCPNLVPNSEDYKVYSIKTPTIPVRIDYPGNASYWDSLAHLWSDWYNQYVRVTDYPRLIVRFEDLYFHVKKMIPLICECAGGELKNEHTFTYLVDSGKWGRGHKGNQTNLISGMIKYGKEKRRFTGFTNDDLTLAYEALDPDLMTTFQYEIPVPP